ncbi:MAG: hypothetical protein IJL66_08400 [Lachnospiraceae bacterium]|nr:hypothetical protein [Lachnospiraceae bacterium]
MKEIEYFDRASEFDEAAEYPERAAEISPPGSDSGRAPEFAPLPEEFEPPQPQTAEKESSRHRLMRRRALRSVVAAAASVLLVYTVISSYLGVDAHDWSWVPIPVETRETAAPMTTLAPPDTQEETGAPDTEAPDTTEEETEDASINTAEYVLAHPNWMARNTSNGDEILWLHFERSWGWMYDGTYFRRMWWVDSGNTIEYTVLYAENKSSDWAIGSSVVTGTFEAQLNDRNEVELLEPAYRDLYTEQASIPVDDTWMQNLGYAPWSEIVPKLMYFDMDSAPNPTRNMGTILFLKDGRGSISLSDGEDWRKVDLTWSLNGDQSVLVGVDIDRFSFGSDTWEASVVGAFYVKEDGVHLVITDLFGDNQLWSTSWSNAWTLEEQYWPE